MHHVAVPHDVILPFNRELPGFSAARLAAEGDQVLPPNHFRLDEATLEVGVDDAGCLGSRGATLDGPCPHLHLARRKERDETQQPVAGPYDRMEPWLSQPGARQEFGAVGRVEFGDLRLEGRADRHHVGSLFFGEGQ